MTQLLADLPDLASFVDRAWELHGDAPQAVADALAARCRTIGNDRAGARAIELAEHVWLAHLHDEAGLDAFLRALPAFEASGDGVAALRRARWVLHAVGEPGARADDAADLPPAVRWRALQSVWAVWCARGQAARVQAALRAELPRALAHADAAARRGLAATCNNLAVELRCGRRGDAALDALMLEAAHGSRALWGSAGSWVHAERAEYQLARCHAALGDGRNALAHAQACLAAIEAHADAPEADAFERFFAHEALAWSERAAADGAAAALQRERMAALLPAIGDAALGAWAAQALAAYDAAA